MGSQTAVTLLKGDITGQDVEAIVNAANSSLLGGGGVDGAIHRAGGPRILEECREIVKRQGKCPPGQAVITSGGNLKARYVIHTVGPIWRGGNENEAEILRDAYYNSLELAKKHGIKTLAFPSISTGAYGYPPEKAALVALSTLLSYVEKNPVFEEIRMVLFSETLLQIYQNAYKTLPCIG